jgi:hypothetical protein
MSDNENQFFETVVRLLVLWAIAVSWVSAVRFATGAP